MNLDAISMVGPIGVTLAYLALYYAFMANLLRVKLKLARAYRERGEKFDRYFAQDRQMLAADRIQLNMLEHMPPFLVLLWIHAFVVSSSEATILGGMYVATRIAYPLALRGRMGRDVPTRLLPITFTGYLILLVFAVRIILDL